MRQEERRARTRAALLRSAQAAIAARGYEGASIDAIATSVGLSKGAVYAHFPNKLELYLGVVSAVLEQADYRVERVAAALREGADSMTAASAYLGLAGDGEHASIIADLWRVAAEEPEVRVALDRYLERRSIALGHAAIDRGDAPAEAMDVASTVGRLIDAEMLYRRLGEVPRSVAAGS